MPSADGSLLILIAFILAEERPEQGVLRAPKGIRHGDTSPRETLLQILREWQPAYGFRCRREDHGIPDAKLMIGGPGPLR